MLEVMYRLKIVTGTFTQPVSTAVADFTPVTPPTDVINVGAGEVGPIDPNVSQTVNQAVGGVNYQPITPGDFTVISTRSLELQVL